MSQAPIEGPSKTSIERQTMPEDNPSVRRGGGGGLTVASSHVSVQKSERHATDLHLEDTEAPDF